MTIASAVSLVASESADAQSLLRRRRFGAGTALGGGVSYNVIPSFEPPRVDWGPQLALFTLELRWVLPNGHSIDVYSPIGNTLVSLALAALPYSPPTPGSLVYAGVGVLYNVRIGTRRVRAIVAPGLEVAGDIGVGGSFEVTRPIKAAVRIPLRVGVDVALGDGRWALEIVSRPFLEVLGYAQNGGREIYSVGVAALVEVALVQY